MVLVGDFDIWNAEQLRRDLSNAAQTCTGQELLIDMRGVTFMDSLALSALVWLHKSLLAEGRRLAVLLAPGTGIESILHITGLTQLFAVTYGCGEAEPA